MRVSVGRGRGVVETPARRPPSAWRPCVAWRPNTCSDERRTAVRVLGVDPGLTRCGVGVVDGAPGRPLSLVAVDVVRTPPDLPVALRLLQVEAALEAWLDRTRPDAVAVERVFSQHNVRTVMGTAQASA